MINRLHIKNFKAFVKADITFSKLTLLTGMNGLGKSTIIQSLLLIRQSFLQNTLKTVGLSLKGDLCSLGRGKDVLNISAESDLLGFLIEWEEGSSLTLEYNLAARLKTRKKGGYTNAELDVLPKSKVDAGPGVYSASLFTNKFQYLSADRRSPGDFFPASIYKVDQLRTLGTRGEYTSHFLAYHQREQVRLSSLVNPAIPNTLLAQASFWLSQITPGIDLVPSVNDDAEIARTGYRFEMGEHYTSEFRAVNVGFGFHHCLPIIVALLAARPGDLVIIENPESHLHPHGQVVLGKLMAHAAHSGVQVIVESHSDHLLNSFCVCVKNGILKPDDILVYYFNRVLGASHHSDIFTPTINELGRISEYPEGFFDEYNRQLDELLK